MTTEQLANALERLKATAARLDGVSRTFAEIDEDPTATYAGADPEGAVTVEVDRRGVVQAVRVADDWRARVGADGLGPAVLTARAAASQARVDAWSTAAEEAHERIEAGVAVAAAPAGAPRRSSAETDELLSALAAARAEREAYAAAATAARAAEVVGSNPAGKVRAVFSGGLPIRIEIDSEWLTFASTSALGGGIRAALEAGRAEREAALAQQRAAFPGVAALRALLGTS